MEVLNFPSKTSISAAMGFLISLMLSIETKHAFYVWDGLINSPQQT
jgi:hypothetical protein